MRVTAIKNSNILRMPQTFEKSSTLFLTLLSNFKKGTLPAAEILSGKNARAWVSMVLLYLKKEMKIKILKQKNPGSHLEVAC